MHLNVFKYRLGRALEFVKEGLALMSVNPGLLVFMEDLEGVSVASPSRLRSWHQQRAIKGELSSLSRTCKVCDEGAWRHRKEEVLWLKVFLTFYVFLEVQEATYRCLLSMPKKM